MDDPVSNGTIKLSVYYYLAVYPQKGQNILRSGLKCTSWYRVFWLCWYLL